MRGGGSFSLLFFPFFSEYQLRGRPLVPEYPKRRAATWYKRYKKVMLKEQWWMGYLDRVRLAKGAGQALKMIDLSIAARGEDAVYLMKKPDLLKAGMTEEEYAKAKGFCGGMIPSGRICKVSDLFFLCLK